VNNSAMVSNYRPQTVTAHEVVLSSCWRTIGLFFPDCCNEQVDNDEISTILRGARQVRMELRAPAKVSYYSVQS
jgi:hypothetical protein